MNDEPTLFQWAESRPGARIIDAVPYLIERIRREKAAKNDKAKPAGEAQIISIPSRGAA